jgi:NADPH-dependent glutamate synthase beta subunit-like oxidoreductase/Fe-S-cluster-containing dehydrogenase component
MSNYYLFQDRKKCIGCHSCEVQCESNKFLPSGSNLCQIVPDGPHVIDGLPRVSQILMSCFHCETPWCVAACPAGAMKKRPRDGIVYVDPLLCIGCKNCIAACPWGSVQWDPEKRQAIKCDFCMDRIDQGLKPACVTVCPSHCLEFGAIEEKMPGLRKKPSAPRMPPREDRKDEVLPQKRCPVNAVMTELERILDTGSLIDPKSRRRTGKILALIQDVAWGRAGADHLQSIESFALKIIKEGSDDISRKTGEFVEQTLTEYHEVFVSHVQSNNCATGECIKIAPAPCQMACPAGMDIPTYVTLIGMGRDAEAIEVIRKDNPFPWVCGLVCTRPCELMCVRGRIDQPVSIKYLKAFSAEKSMVEGRYLNPAKEPDKDQKVCIIGAGPAGLSAAYYLRLMGYGVRIVESLSTAGGMMLLGIPRYRLPCRVIDLEAAMLEELGVDFRFNTSFGKDVTLDSLSAEGFEAFFFAIGAHKSFKLNIPGETDYPQVTQAIDLLRRVALGDWQIPGERVVIIGGGNVAIDAARTCIRLGCKEVILAYRRERTEMPADVEEVEQAEEEGVKISFLTIPVAIIGTGLDQNGRVTALRCVRAEMITQEGSSRKVPVPIEGSEYLVETEAVISAIGQQVDQDCLSSIPRLKWTRRNTLFASRVNMKTSVPGVFAAGDAVSGPATVIEAIGGGKRAADAIDRYLSEIPQPRIPPVPVRRGRIDWIEIPAKVKMELKRPVMSLLPIDRRRKTFQQAETGYPEKRVRQEAARCLRCDICTRCGRCVEICRDKIKVDALKMGYLDFDRPGPTDFTITETRCVLCGACAANCPTGAMRMEDSNGERVLSLCGTILNRRKLIHCESCGAVMGTAGYHAYIRNKHQPVIPVADPRTLCHTCARKTMAAYMATRLRQYE